MESTGKFVTLLSEVKLMLLLFFFIIKWLKSNTTNKTVNKFVKQCCRKLSYHKKAPAGTRLDADGTYYDICHWREDLHSTSLSFSVSLRLCVFLHNLLAQFSLTVLHTVKTAGK